MSRNDRYSIPLNTGLDGYHRLDFDKNGFENFNLVGLRTLGDGSCYFHGVLNAYFIPYREACIHMRGQMAHALRRELANKLRENSNIEGKSNYDVLAKGELSVLGKECEEFSLETLENKLNSNEWVGNEYHELISEHLNKDIYILDFKNRDIYMTGDDSSLIYKGRESIILLYLHNHYETVALISTDTITHFLPNHPLIEFLKLRMKERLKRVSSDEIKLNKVD
jgi:hypothetical protein